MKVNIMGIDIDSIGFEEAIERIEGFISQRSIHYIVTPNVDHLIKLQKDEEFREIYKNASMVLPDGVPLLWAGRFLGTPLKEKVSGSDLFPALCKVSSEKGYRLFFLGSTDHVLKKVCKILKSRYPNLKITGAYAPSFKIMENKKENEEIIRMIKSKRPDILFVGLGAPKQERWIYRNLKRINVPVSIGIGISFDYMAGEIRRAPKWMQRIGLEWFYRLLQEPKRLWKRYLIDDMKFFYYILLQKLDKRFLNGG
ncbi:MAG: WecB/TagA/CpsF family glycosyltransferase [bacterium]|nr:WecB/TagA/CpsF family glycosyltransferase [bacterium]